MSWSRSLWMRLAALNNFVAVAVWTYVTVIDPGFAEAEQWRLGSQIQFMHGMAAFTCATFMNVGALSARHAPACFLGGSALLCSAMYAGAATTFSGRVAIEIIGGLVILVGWLVLAWSARTIDRTH